MEVSITMPSRMTKMDFRFVIPTDVVLSNANDLLMSDNQDHRDIGKVVTDLTVIQKTIQESIQHEMTNDGTVDLAPWFDYWFGDTIETAQRLKDSPQIPVSHVAHVLLDQESAIIHSKESFLKEMKRLDVRPKHDD